MLLCPDLFAGIKSHTQFKPTCLCAQRCYASKHGDNHDYDNDDNEDVHNFDDHEDNENCHDGDHDDNANQDDDNYDENHDSKPDFYSHDAL